MAEQADADLYAAACQRLEHFAPRDVIPAEEVYRKLDITDADLAGYDQIELEIYP